MGSVSVITEHCVIFIIILLQKYHLDGTVTYEVDKLDQDLLVVTYLLFGAGEEHQVSSMSINISMLTVVKISSTISKYEHTCVADKHMHLQLNNIVISEYSDAN